jgi:hypothetical protein
MSAKVSAVSVILVVIVVGAQVPIAAQQRTVIDKQAASIFQTPPPGTPKGVYGAIDGNWTGMEPQGVHVRYANFPYFSADDWAAYHFPLSALHAYEDAEVAAGRPRIFLYATYDGVDYPVYNNFGNTMALSGSAPTTAQTHWWQAINVCDPRYVRFWINFYQRPVIQSPYYSTIPVFWTQNDNGAFGPSLYGIVDGSRVWHSGVTWDAGFPQTSSEYYACMKSFYDQVAQLAPDIQNILNIATWDDYTQFQNVAGSLSGVMVENLNSWSGGSGRIRDVYHDREFTWFPWMASQGKIVLTRATVSDTPTLLSSFVTYMLLEGPNSFFAPGNSGITTDPALWEPWQARLGEPTAAATIGPQIGPSTGYRLYSRTFEGGVAYLNLSGSTQTIALPAGTWYNPSGTIITSITLSDLKATFASTKPGIPKRPEIAPRAAFPYQGPLSVTLSTDVSGATIRYTIDGAEPTSSSIAYSSPITISSNTTVKAKTFTSTGVPSYTNTMSYIVGGTPVVSFVNATDDGRSGTYYPVLQLSDLPNGPVSVDYSVARSNGSTSTGQVSFLPNQTRPYRYFPVTVGTSGLTTITITRASGAIVGSRSAFQYTVGSAASAGPDPPTNLSVTVQ